MDFRNAVGLAAILAVVFPVVSMHEYWCVGRGREFASVCASYALTTLLFVGTSYSALSMISSGQQFDGIMLAWSAIAGAIGVIALQIVLFVTARLHAGKDIAKRNTSGLDS